MPRYPEISVSSASENPLAVVAEVRQALRRAGVGRSEIRRFSSEALAQKDPLSTLEICQEWVGRAATGSEP